MIADHLLPRLYAAGPMSADDVAPALAVVAGHRMAKAAIETACWDLESKHAGVPLWQHLGGLHSEIPCGVSIGIQDSPEQLLEKIDKEVSAGYQRIKIKIKPGWDVDIVRRVRRVRFTSMLHLDTNIMQVV